MPGLTGPLLSLDASGTIAKTLTYSKWRGIKYARQRVIPANPNTIAQQAIRSTFAYMNEMWKWGDATLLDPYLAGAKGRPLTDRNLFQKTNVPAAYSSNTSEHILASPGVGGAPGTFAMSLTAFTNHIGINLNPNLGPPGWTVLSGAAIAWEPSDPTVAVFKRPIYSDTNANPALLDITGLPGTTLFNISAYAVWTTAEGKLAYSIARNQQESTT